MDIKEKLKLYNQFMQGVATTEVLQNAKEISEMMKTDTELKDFVSELYKVSSIEERNKLIEKYGVEEKKEETEEELISKTFGVDISEIEHKTLESGKDVFVFYDPKYSRKRILENPKEGLSLTEQLKEIQNENKDFQTDNYKENANDILKKQALEELDSELKMIYIGDIGNYQNIINGLKEKERKAFDELLKRKDELNIKYINIENIVALDENGNMLEGYIDKNSLEAKIESPKENRYNVDQMDNKEAVNEQANSNDENENEETIEIGYNDLEDIPNLIEAEVLLTGKQLTSDELRKMCENVISYYKNPDSMIKLSDAEREFYERFTVMLAEKQELKKSRNSTPQMTYTYAEDLSGKNGFLNIIFLSLIMIMLVMLVIYIMN